MSALAILSITSFIVSFKSQSNLNVAQVAFTKHKNLKFKIPGLVTNSYINIYSTIII